MADSVKVEVTPDKSEHRAMKDSVCRDSQSNQEGTNTLSDLPRIDAGEIQNSEKLLGEETQSQSSESANGLSIIVSTKSDNLQQKQSFGTESQRSPTSTGVMSSSTRESVLDQQSGRYPNSSSDSLQYDKLMRTPSRCIDKALDDGYNWRKYGQKLVKGNEFVRSYYRCTYPNCSAKRQVERSQNGKITDTIYIDKHEHVKSQPRFQTTVSIASPIQSIQPDAHALAAEEDKSVDGDGPTSRSQDAKLTGSPQLISISPVKNALNDSNPQPATPNLMIHEINHDCDPPAKRQKTDICGVEKTPVAKPYVEPRSVGEERVAVQTVSEVDALQDGYRWRKYGQKLVKGNLHPRSYYRCSSSGCPMKKHVERASHDPKAVITTYEGQHNHDMPPARTVMPPKGGPSANSTSVEDKIGSKPEENLAIGLDVVVHVRSN